MTQWEYYVGKDLSLIELAALGKEGWELCGIIPDLMLGITNGAEYIFKRPKR